MGTACRGVRCTALPSDRLSAIDTKSSSPHLHPYCIRASHCSHLPSRGTRAATASLRPETSMATFQGVASSDAAPLVLEIIKLTNLPTREHDRTRYPFLRVHLEPADAPPPLPPRSPEVSPKDLAKLIEKERKSLAQLEKRLQQGVVSRLGRVAKQLFAQLRAREVAEFLAEGGCPDKALHAELEAAAAAVEVAREGLRALDADALEELRVADSPPSAPVREAVEAALGPASRRQLSAVQAPRLFLAPALPCTIVLLAQTWSSCLFEHLS